MQRKAVRFTSHNEVYSPVLFPAHTPTNTSSPPVRLAHPFSNDPPRQQPLSLPSIHPFLEFKDENGYIRHNFNIDLSTDPNTALPMSNPMFQQLAITPPIASITLACEALPWEVIIHAKPDAALVVADIFQVLHRNLRQAVLHEEYKIEGAQRRSEVDRALAVRRKCAGEYSEDVRRRVDFLTLQHRFLGLSPTRQADVWQLHVSF